MHPAKQGLDLPTPIAETIGVAHYGLGPIGLEVARLVGERPGIKSTVAVDISPELKGVRIGDAVVSSSLPPDAGKRATIALHCTSSSLRKVMSQLLELVEAGLNVISTCEELAYPWAAEPSLSAQLDLAAQSRGVSVLGTGVNPGYAMDYLVLVLSAAAKRVDSVHVTRVQDAAARRLPLQRKIGAGMTVDEFRARVEAGSLGHVGLRQSAEALVNAFGWELSTYRETIEPVLADKAVREAVSNRQTGPVVGLQQIGRAYSGDRLVVTLDLLMAMGSDSPRDHIRLSGDPDLELVIPGGFHGDVTTASVVVNAIHRVIEARPGLRVMADIAPPHP